MYLTSVRPHIAVVYAICFAFLMHQFSSVYTAVEFPLLEIKEDSANVPKADADTSVSSLSNGSDHRDKRMVSTTSHPNTAHSLYCSILFITIYLVAICISLAPAHLIEVRYFTPAVMILILRTPFKVCDIGLCPSPLHTYISSPLQYTLLSICRAVSCSPLRFLPWVYMHYQCSFFIFPKISFSCVGK